MSVVILSKGMVVMQVKGMSTYVRGDTIKGNE